MKRKTTPPVRAVLLDGPDPLKKRARELGVRAIRYSNGHVRIRGRGFADFNSEQEAAAYLERGGKP